MDLASEQLGIIHFTLAKSPKNTYPPFQLALKGNYSTPKSTFCMSQINIYKVLIFQKPTNLHVDVVYTHLISNLGGVGGFKDFCRSTTYFRNDFNTCPRNNLK